MIAAGELGALHFVHGAYLQDWLLEPTDFSWRLEPDKGGASSAIGDIGSHWCDLVQHVAGQRIVEVLADLTTVVDDAAQAGRGDRGVRGEPATTAREPVAITQRRSRHDPRAVRRRREGLRLGRPGLRRPQERSVVRGQRPAGVAALAAGAAERAVDRPPRRGERACCRRTRRCSRRARAPTRTCRAGTRRAGPDAFCNVMRDIYGFIADGKRPLGSAAAGVRHVRRRLSRGLPRRRDSRQPSRGGVWTRSGDERSETVDEAWSVHAGVRQADDRRDAREGAGARHVQAIELGTGGWPGRDHLDLDALLDNKPCARRLPADDRRRRA